MTVNWTLFYIGISAFIIGIIIRLYFGMKLKSMIQSDIPDDNPNIKLYKRLVFIGKIIFWSGSFISIIAI